MRWWSFLVVPVVALVAASPALGATAGSLDPRFGAGGVWLEQLDLGPAPQASSFDSISLVRQPLRDDAVPTGFFAATATRDADGLSRVTVRGYGAAALEWAEDEPSRFPAFVPAAPADMPYLHVTATATAEGPAGTLLVAGWGGANGLSPHDLGFVQRYRYDGTLDPDFGDGGTVRFSVPDALVEREATFNAMQVAGDGRVTLAGQDRAPAEPARGLIVRLRSDGGLDTSLNGTGYVTSAEVSTWKAVVSIPRGEFWALGETAGGPAVAKFDKTGAVDAGFGTGGLARTPQISTSTTGAPKTIATSLALDGDQAVVAGRASWRQGAAPGQGVFESWMLRFTRDGAVDTSFGAGGIARWRFGEDGDGTWADSGIAGLMTQRNSSLVAVGSAGTSDGAAAGHAGGLVIRVRHDGSLDPRFGTAGVVRLNLGGAGADTALRAAAIGDDRTLMVAGGMTKGTTTTSAIVDLVGDGDPTADLRAPAKAVAGRPIVLDATHSADDWGIGTTEWDLDGNGSFESLGRSCGRVDPCFSARTVLPVGRWTLRVRVTDSSGQASVASVDIKVVVPFAVKLPAKRVRLHGAAIGVPVTCRAPGPCQGLLRLTRAGTSVTAGRASLALAGGRRRVVRIVLTRAMRRLVRRNRATAFTLDVGAAGVARPIQSMRLVVRR